MAVSTTVTLNDITQAVAIEPAFLGYVADYRVVEPFVREFDLMGRGSGAVQIPRMASILGTINDGGTGVDTEFDATQGTDLTTTTTMSTDPVTVTSIEYAIYMAITDNVGEDSAIPTDVVMDEILGLATEALLAAWEDDVLALFASLNGGTAVGATTVDLSLANLSSAIVTIRDNGVRAPDGLVAVLAPIQGTDFENAVQATGTSMAVFDRTADRFMAIERDAANGLAGGFIGAYRGVPLFVSGYCDFANMSADRVGAMFVPMTARNARFAALGKSVSRGLRLETQRDATLRGNEIVASMRWGSAELQDAAGVPIVTDA